MKGCNCMKGWLLLLDFILLMLWLPACKYMIENFIAGL